MIRTLKMIFREIKDIKTNLTKVLFQADDTKLVSLDWAGNATFYETQNLTKVHTYWGSAPILDCAFTTRTEQIILGGVERQIRLHNILTNTTEVIGEHDFPVKCLKSYPQKSMLVSGSWDMSIKLWDLCSNTCIKTKNLPGKVYALDYSNNLIVSALSNKEILVFDIRNLDHHYQRYPTPLKNQTRDLQCLPNDTGFVISSVAGRVGVEYFHSQKSFSFRCHRKGNQIYSVNSVKCHPESKTFATGGSDSEVFIWDSKNKKRAWQGGYSKEVVSLSFNSDGSLLAVGCSDLYFTNPSPNSVTIEYLEDSFCKVLN